MECLEVFQISALRLVSLTIYNFGFSHRTQVKLVISASRLKFFDFRGMYLPLLGINECIVLEKVQIHMLQSVVRGEMEEWMQEHVFEMLRMAERLSHAKSLKIYHGTFLR